MNRERLKADLYRDEGVRAKPYRDTVGKLTIGVGRNLDDRGLAEDEIDHLLENDIDGVIRDLDRAFPWWTHMTEGRRRALANMAFNLGIFRLMKFEKMLAYLAIGNYGQASKEALDSRWADQVGARARRIAELFRTG